MTITPTAYALERWEDVTGLTAYALADAWLYGTPLDPPPFRLAEGFCCRLDPATGVYLIAHSQGENWKIVSLVTKQKKPKKAKLVFSTAQMGGSH